MKIRNVCAVVTGGGAGAGKGLAARLAQEGASVVIVDIDADAAEEAARGIRSRGGGAVSFAADMRKGADIEEVIRIADSQPYRFAVLINNAGGGGERPPHFPGAPVESWEAKLNLNLLAPMRATQLALQSMKGREGAIINIASTAGLGLSAYQSPEYAAAKAGLIRFTASLAKLPDSTGVRVNCLVPDWIWTERAQLEFEAMSAPERAAAPEPVTLDALGNAAVELIQNDALSGRVMVLRGSQSRLLPADEPAS